MPKNLNPHKSITPYRRYSTQEIESQLLEKARQKILESQLINRSIQLIDNARKIWMTAFNFNIEESIKNTIQNSGFNFGVPFSTPKTSKAISRPINPLFGIRGENSSGIPGTDCFVCSLEALNYGTLFQRNTIAENINSNTGFLYKQVDTLLEHIGRLERLFTFNSFKVSMQYLTNNDIANIIDNIADLFLANNTAIMLVIFRSSGAGHYTVIQKKNNQITIIEPQPSISCGIPKSVSDYLNDEQYRFIISNIGFLIPPDQAVNFNNKIVTNSNMQLINYRESLGISPVAQGIKKTRRKKNKHKQEKTKQEKTKRKKTKQEKMKRKKTKHEKMKQEKMKQEKTKRKKTKHEKTKHEKTKHEKTKQEKSKQEKTRKLKDKQNIQNILFSNPTI